MRDYITTWLHLSLAYGHHKLPCIHLLMLKARQTHCNILLSGRCCLSGKNKESISVLVGLQEIQTGIKKIADFVLWKVSPFPAVVVSVFVISESQHYSTDISWKRPARTAGYKNQEVHDNLKHQSVAHAGSFDVTFTAHGCLWGQQQALF